MVKEEGGGWLPVLSVCGRSLRNLGMYNALSFTHSSQQCQHLAHKCVVTVIVWDVAAPDLT